MQKKYLPCHRRYNERNPDTICSFILKDGTRCGAYRAKRSLNPTRCSFHQRMGGTSSLARPWEGLPVMYSRYVGPTLREALAAELSRPRSEQVELYEELAMLRTLTADVVRTWSTLAELGKHAEAMAMADLMKDNFDHIKSIANTISTIEARANDEVNVHTLNGIVAQMVSMLYSVCGVENEDLARVFASRIKNELVIPTLEAKGTTITPDETVQSMDDTIPQDE